MYTARAQQTIVMSHEQMTFNLLESVKNNIPYGDELRECDGHCETCHQEHE